MAGIPTYDFSINSLIGDGSIFKGEFHGKGPFRVDGSFIGKIDSFGKVYVGKTGNAEGCIIAKNVTVGGTFKGDIFAEDNVIVLRTGTIIGNIYSCSVNMEDGVIFDGECRILSKDDMKELIDIKKNEKFTF
ncbi:MAG: hypothetical protein A2086_00165 [Spirochaetes bacterium GWD1_27_9]|nr:MAG: hypothetical protein A2Z98_04185 [Spirochaetes bacterium GWB1_27_13]OHD20022.1 MAG: hypothetical protein A2Y34_08200 [Spirochaetes bacterium GWC1_27_15]OHD30487.1 MAG: hypothetical protein A2086_00165 [Spirochaetes bacterium GWD1_27_9]